jgi:hypothetical protein
MISSWSCELSRAREYTWVYHTGIYPKNACLIQNMMIHQQLLFRVLEDEDIPKNFRRTSAMFFWTSKLCGPLPFPGPLGRKLSYIEHQRLPWHPEGSGMEVVDSCWFCKRLPQLNMWLCPEIDYTWHSEMAMFGSAMRGTPWQNPVEHVLHSKFKWKSSIVPSNQWARPSCSATHGYKWSTGYVDRRFIWVYDIWVNKLIRSQSIQKNGKKTWLGYCFIQAWGSLVLIRIQICPGVSIPWCPGGPKLAGFLPEETSMNEPKICLFTICIHLIHISDHITNHQICISTNIYIICIWVNYNISLTW